VNPYPAHERSVGFHRRCVLGSVCRIHADDSRDNQHKAPPVPGVASALGAAVVEVLRSALVTLDTLEPAEQAAIVGTLVADLRARRPMSVEPRTRSAP
jgi:hypothetical protein